VNLQIIRHIALLFQPELKRQVKNAVELPIKGGTSLLDFLMTMRKCNIHFRRWIE
jgi:hypothetical protein